MLNLTAELETFIPQIAASYEASVIRTYDSMVAKLGPTLRNVSNEWGFARAWTNLVGQYVRREGNKMNGATSIDAERLAKGAAAYAAMIVAEWNVKVTAKLECLEDARLLRANVNGASFVITGTRDGKKITIEQIIVHKVSTKGTPFCQFPARIYVDGKFTSEAAYKKIWEVAA